MKKYIIPTIASLALTPVFASDYIQQEVTSEVFTETKQVEVVNENYYVNHRPYHSTYCQYKDDRNYCNQAKPKSYNLQPVSVYTGKTVTVQKHYDVYQPRVVYDKVGSYTTTKVCRTCK